MSTEKDYLSDFGYRLGLMLHEEGLTQEDFGKKIGVSQSAVNKWVHGTLPGSAELMKIAKYFGKSPDQLLGWDRITEKLRSTFGIAEALAKGLPGTHADQNSAFNRFAIYLNKAETAIAKAKEGVEEAERALSLISHEYAGKKKTQISSKPPSQAGRAAKKLISGPTGGDPQS